ncbi:MAG: phenylacetate--CoA ligase family protein [Desulfobacteraceae bacterium]|nr:phenylacetate--CoA ligase family protein [Desulfobacteraceae bacterium]MBC2757859.1 phenylacetate--CoA ligase family protein [Desulfobacteraceae bacterium]
MMFKEIIHYFRNPYKSFETLKRLQWQKLQSVLHYAYAQVPFYRDRFDRAGIKPSEIRSASDMFRIPVLTKEELRDAGFDILAGGHNNPAKLKKSTTSGSTGQPTSSYFTLRDWFILKFLLKYRSKRICGFYPVIHKVVLVNANPEEAVLRENKKIINKLIRKRSVSINQKIEDHLTVYRQFKPDVLYGTVSYFNELKNFLLKNQINWLKPKMIFTSGEINYPQTRKEIERVLGCPCYDIYGSTEFKEVAWECSHKLGYHINMDAYFVEFINNNRHVSAFEEGRIVITSLVNQAMPLIRYDQGDTGMYTNGGCADGINFPFMHSVTGRSMDYYELSDGRRIAPFSLVVAVHECAAHAVQQFQIIQKSSDLIVIKIVPNRQFTPVIEQNLHKRYHQILGGNVVTRIEIVKEIERDSSNKYRLVRSEFK